MNFTKIFILLTGEYERISELGGRKYGLKYAGYRDVSVGKNLGYFLTLFWVTKVVFVGASVLLFFVKTENRGGRLRLGRRCVRMLENVSTPAYFNFEISTSIIQIICAFVYLRFSETYYGYMLSSTRILHIDMFLSIISLSSTLYLCIHLFATAHNKGWYTLHSKLIQRRYWYAKKHR